MKTKQFIWVGFPVIGLVAIFAALCFLRGGWPKHKAARMNVTKNVVQRL